ncbi:hypothetical protein pb186bvf_012567 [Paramecium bursaria]
MMISKSRIRAFISNDFKFILKIKKIYYDDNAST